MKIKNWVPRLLSSLKSVREIKNGIIIFGLSLVPVFVMSAILQIMIDQNKLPGYRTASSNISQNYNSGTLIYYLTISFLHIILCIVASYYFVKKAKSNLSLSLIKTISRYRFVCAVIIVAIFFIMDSFKPNISLLSHDRIFDVLRKSDFFAVYFKMFPCDYFNINIKLFYAFSIFPFLLIFLALVIIVVSSFSIGKDLARFQKISYEEFCLDEIDKEIENIMTNMKNYIFGLSIILATSTIATILFFQLPVPVFQDQVLQAKYQKVSYSMGFCWGMIFSLTMVAMCLFPIIVVLRKLNKIGDTERYKKDNKFKHWVIENQNKLSLFNNLKTVFSVFSPIFISLVTQFFSKGI